MKRYTVLQKFIDDGQTFSPGSAAEFGDLRAGQLQRFGLISDHTAPQPEADPKEELDAPEPIFELNSETDSQDAEADVQPKRKGKK
jgi:hypothetical protein